MELEPSGSELRQTPPAQPAASPAASSGSPASPARPSSSTAASSAAVSPVPSPPSATAASRTLADCSGPDQIQNSTCCRLAAFRRSHSQHTHAHGDRKPAGVNIKEEPRDEIKDYAETTMNELLGWYGYNDVIHKEDTLNLDLKRFAPNGDKLVSYSERSVPVHQSAGGVAGGDNNRKPDNGQGGSKDLASKNETIVAALSVIGKKIKEEERKESADQDSRLVAEALEMSMASPEMSAAESDGGATCEQASELSCAWCLKSAGEKPFTFNMDDKTVKVFCSDLCFTMCRRASFKKSKVCDWCKKVKNTVSYVDFQDGEQQLQFCGEQCLNQYKMNIFCKETQSIKSQLGSAIVAPSDGTKQIIITPDLWTEQQQQRRQDPDDDQDVTRRQPDGRDQTRLTRDDGYRDEKDACRRHGYRAGGKPKADFGSALRTGSKPRYEASAVNGHGTSEPGADRLSTPRAACLDGKALKSPKLRDGPYGGQCHQHHHHHQPRPASGKSSAEASLGGKASSASCCGSMASSKQGSKTSSSSSAAAADSSSLAYAPYSLAASPGSDLSSTPRSTAASHGAGVGPRSSPSALAPGSQPVLGCLAPPPTIQPWMYGPLLASGLPGFGLIPPGLPLRQSTVTSPPPPAAPPSTAVGPPPSGQDKRGVDPIAVHPAPQQQQQQQQQQLQSQPGSLPPRPPPFSLFPMPPPNPSNLFAMLATPPGVGMPGLLPGGAAGLVPPMAGMGGLLPPNTLMVPYPVLVPLPIPLPLAIPIPVPCDKAGNPMLPPIPNTETPIRIKDEKQDAACYRTSSAEPHSGSCTNAGVDRRITCACCNRKPADPERPMSSSRAQDSPPPGSRSPCPQANLDRLPPASAPSIQNDVIDLSKDRRRSASDVTPLLDGVDQTRTNAMTSSATATSLRVSPSSSESDGSSHVTLGVLESVYSARRSLILDAPSLPKDRSRNSPGLEKRLYVGGSLTKEPTYGKRRCMRPRIRTK